MIPRISAEVCEVFDKELGEIGIEGLGIIFSAFENLQPDLMLQMAAGLTSIAKLHGTLAAEAACRLAVIVYRLIEIQLEVNDLEKT